MPTTPSSPPAAPAAERLGWLRMVRERGFRRLLGVRFAAQWGDGMFQAALGGAVLFNPERQADPLAVAAGLAVILLPYSVVGPFAGALLDRWDRRRVLLVANLLRAVLTVVVAVIVFAGVAGPPLYLAALAVAGVSRFVLAGLSAALPHVVARAAPRGGEHRRGDGGAGVAALGGATAIGARALFGAGDTGSALTTAAAATGSVLAAVLAAGFAARLLGPGPRATSPTAPWWPSLRGLADGARGHRAHTDRRGVVPRAGRAPAGVRRQHAAHAAAVPATRSPARARCAAGWPASGRRRAWPRPGSACAALLTPWLVHRLGPCADGPGRAGRRRGHPARCWRRS